MAQISLTIPDAHLHRIVEALCARPLPPLDPTGANAKLVILDWIRECVQLHERRLADQALVVDVTNIVS